MSKLRQSDFAPFIVALGLALGTFGGKCDAVPVQKSTLACDANVAVIAMWDGKLQKICGCGGVDGEFVSTGTPLNCTFALADGKTIHVHYMGPFLQHQFKGTGTPIAPTGPVFDPNSKSPIRSHAFTLTAAGTYTFEDEYDHMLSGSIVITP